MQRILLVLWLLFAFVPSHPQGTLNELRSNVKETINGKEYYIHTVKKGHSLYMISKAYDTDVNEIIRENPAVKEGLKAGMKLRIPVPGGKQPIQKNQQPAPAPAPAPEIPEKNIPPEEATILPCEQAKPDKKQVSRVALMIPLYLDEAASIETSKTSSTGEETDYRSLRFIEFYEGFLVALDSLEKSDIAIKLYVYDVPKDTLKTRAILKKEEMKGMDLIIGLVYSKNFRMISEFALANHIPLVNPLTDRDEILTGNPLVFKVRPGLESQPDHLAEYLAAHHDSDNIITVVSDMDTYGNAAAELERSCEDKNIRIKTARGYGDLLGLLSKENGNAVIIYSGDRVSSLDLITKLNEIRTDYRITVFGLPQWDELEDELEAEYLVNLKTHIMAPYFIDYTDPEIKKFVKAFQQKYYTDPGHLAFQGFDVAYYFLSALQKFGNQIDRCIPDFRMKSLETDFQFRSSDKNGFENLHWVIYSFDNYRKVKEN